MQLSITTDFAEDTGNPEPYLRQIAEAGFTHIHWCHHWCTDFVYSKWEVDQIAAWLRDYGLKMLDLHASAGVEKRWGSHLEYERLAGVDLVKNRIEMAARLGADVIVMHPGTPVAGHEETFWKQLCGSLDALEPCARDLNVRIALENGEWSIVQTLLDKYPRDYVGVCYDSGHGNIGFGSLAQLDQAKDRLICIHLHDNNGSGDQHNLVFSGTVDWAHLARILAGASYSKCVSMEVSMRNAGVAEGKEFLERAFETGIRFSDMVALAKRQMEAGPEKNLRRSRR